MTPHRPGRRTARRFACAMRALAAPAVLLLAAGCQPTDATSRLENRLEAAQEENDKLLVEREELRGALAGQRKQIHSLMDLGDKRVEKLFTVIAIELGRHTGGVDTDGEPGHDAVKVILQPIDRHGSVLKAAGDVTIQLFDLAEKPKELLIGTYRFPVATIHEHWSSGFVSYHYSFKCPWKAGPPAHKTVTIRVTFLDYLTGKEFSTQKAVEIKLPPDAETQPAE